MPRCVRLLYNQGAGRFGDFSIEAAFSVEHSLPCSLEGISPRDFPSALLHTCFQLGVRTVLALWAVFFFRFSVWKDYK